jgi:hypothetical protein
MRKSPCVRNDVAKGWPEELRRADVCADASKTARSWYGPPMPIEDQHRVSEIVRSEVERRTRGDDGWCWAWASALTFVSSSEGMSFEGAIFFDRDVVDEAKGRRLVRQIEDALRREHRDIPERLRFGLVPTTRLEYAYAIVASEFKLMATVDRGKMIRTDGDGSAQSWVRLGEIERRLGWTGRADRIRVQMYADSSVDEEDAKRLGEDWLAALGARFPEVASLVTVVGDSH